MKKFSPSCALWLFYITLNIFSGTEGTMVISTCPLVSQSFTCNCVNTRQPPDLVCSKSSHSDLQYDRSTFTTLLQTRDNSQKFSIGVLDLSGINLSNTESNFLQGLASVRSIKAQHCGLTTVPPAFRQVHGLQLLDLSNNYFSSFLLDTIANMSVHHLKLAANNLWQIQVEASFPSSLTILDVHHNNLRHLPSVLWEGLSELHLSYNAITELPIIKSSVLRVLDVSHNQLNHFPIGFATPLLHTLNIASNHVQQWGRLSSQLQLSSLKHLDLSNNHLQVMSDSLLTYTPQLIDLDLSHNKLTHLSGSHFSSQCTSLDTLNLSHNGLVILQQDTFLHLHHLRLLNLSHNSLLGKSGLVHLELPEYLISLDLQHCSLMHVDFCQLNQHDLKHLYLNHNPLQCDCQLYLLYQRHRNWARNKEADSSDSLTWKCTSSQTGKMISVAMQQPCSASAVQCLTKAPSLPVATEMEVTVSVVLAEHNLITSWHLSNGLSLIQGFRVLCLHPGEEYNGDNAVHTSPILGSQLRSYTLAGIDNDIRYTVCVDIMHNSTHILKRVCKIMHAGRANILVGILAGSIFLIPCLVFVFYIIVKDKRIVSMLKQDDSTDSQHSESLLAPNAVYQESTMKEIMNYHPNINTGNVPLLNQPSTAQLSQSATDVCIQTDTNGAGANVNLSSDSAVLSYAKSETTTTKSTAQLSVHPPQITETFAPHLTDILQYKPVPQASIISIPHLPEDNSATENIIN